MSLDAEAPHPDFRSGAVVFVGRPNVGKSTLFNALVGARLAIVTAKPQTTRDAILGVVTTDSSQMLFRDTPGLLDPRYRLQEYMRKEIDRALEDADVALGLVDVTDLEGSFDDEAADAFAGLGVPRLFALNKIDRGGPAAVKAAEAKVRDRFPEDTIAAVSALKGSGLDKLRAAIERALPVGPMFYPEDTLTEHPERYYVAELIREQVFLLLRQELPYSMAVVVREFREDEPKVYIGADIVVEKQSQKGIVIGAGAKMLKSIGRRSREQIEGFLERPVYLDLHVKVYENWRKKDGLLKGFGYAL